MRIWLAIIFATLFVAVASPIIWLLTVCGFLRPYRSPNVVVYDDNGEPVEFIRRKE